MINFPFLQAMKQVAVVRHRQAERERVAEDRFHLLHQAAEEVLRLCLDSLQQLLEQGISLGHELVHLVGDGASIHQHRGSGGGDGGGGGGDGGDGGGGGGGGDRCRCIIVAPLP